MYLFSWLVFLRQTGLTEIFATLENLGLWLLGEDMLKWIEICDEEGYLWSVNYGFMEGWYV